MFSLITMSSHLLLLPLLLLLPIFVLTLRKRISSKPQLPPCPPKLPFIGNLHQIGGLTHQSLHRLSEKYGPVMLLRLGQIPTLVVSSGDMAREILKTHDHIFASRPSSKIVGSVLGGNGIAFEPYGEQWKQMRKLCVNHLLGSKMVHSFRLLREEEVASLIGKIAEISMSSSGVVNMSEVFISFTNTILLKTLSGKYFRESGRRDLIYKLVEEGSIVLGTLSVIDFFPSLGWLDLFAGDGARARRLGKRWDDVLDEVKQDHTRRSREMVDDHDEGKRGKVDLLSVLLDLHKDEYMEAPLSKETIKAILQDMIAAGTETSFSVLDWVLAELTRNSKTMERLKDEVRGIASAESMVREEHLNKMSYLKAVIKEVLRLHPPVPLLIPRESMDRCQVHGYEVPKMTRVLVNAWSIGRDPQIWEAPKEFRPERFLGSPVDFRGHGFEFIPFGAGRRICPGLQFAVSNLELTLANLVHRFDWELPDGVKSEDLDMAESPGLTTRRRQTLHLVAKPLFA